MAANKENQSEKQQAPTTTTPAPRPGQGIAIEDVHRWLGELYMSQKLTEKDLATKIGEIRRLQAALAEKK